MKMEFYTPKVCCLVLLLGCFFTTAAQDEKKESITVQKYTVMDKFAPELVPTASERLALKEDRIAHQIHTKMILDTLDISKRKRRRLLRELKRNPFSDQLDKIIMAETHFEDSAIKSDSNQ